MKLEPGQLIQAISYDLLRSPDFLSYKVFTYMIVRLNPPLDHRRTTIRSPLWTVYDIINESYCNVYEETLIQHYKEIE